MIHVETLTMEGRLVGKDKDRPDKICLFLLDQNNDCVAERVISPAYDSPWRTMEQDSSLYYTQDAVLEMAIGEALETAMLYPGGLFFETVENWLGKSNSSPALYGSTFSFVEKAFAARYESGTVEQGAGLTYMIHAQSRTQTQQTGQKKIRIRRRQDIWI